MLGEEGALLSGLAPTESFQTRRRPRLGAWGDTLRTKAGHSLAGRRLGLPSRARALKDTPRPTATLGSPDLGPVPARRRGQPLRRQLKTTLTTPAPELRTPRTTSPPPISRSNLPGAATRANTQQEPFPGQGFGGLSPASESLLVRPGGGGTRRLGSGLRAPDSRHKPRVRLRGSFQVRASLSTTGGHPPPGLRGPRQQPHWRARRRHIDNLTVPRPP